LFLEVSPMLSIIKARCAQLWVHRGQAMPEYAVIAAAIIVAAYVTFQAVGTAVNTTMTTVLGAL